MNKTKILAYCDSPAIETGFAQIAKRVLGALDPAKYEIIVVAVNHKSIFYDKKKYPYTIIGDLNELMSVQTFMQLVVNWDYDILWTSHDFGVLKNYVETIKERRAERKFKWVAYMPVDSDLFHPENLSVIEASDIPLVYSKFGKQIITNLNKELGDKTQVAYLGTDDDFEPSSAKQRRKVRKKYLKVDDDTFVVMNLNRNQFRKDPFKTLQAFSGFAKGKKTVLYMHMPYDDPSGTDLKTLAISLGIGHLVKFPEYKDNIGLPREMIPQLYSAADLVISTTKAEGWGLSTTESFACKTPVVMPNNSSLTELVGEKEQRGYLCDAGRDADHWVVDYTKSEYPRPMVHLDSLIAKMETIYKDWQTAHDYQGTETGKKIEAAYKWVKKLTWEKVTKQWIEIIK